ncbi:hypothetical protein CI109_107053 [Kwoniella shandongensis]|uniref:Zn(2)-C6 fungal-type domain-containing protein n=1 Tax=Kwoniella shandongensis TaxID=1734106 RepID=A0AAJ8LSP2_9TREE
MSDVESSSGGKRQASEQVEEEYETKKKIKRTRAKLTCLACKKRKTKCDKIYPCSACVTRGVGGECQYEEGIDPPRSSSLNASSSSPSDELLALQHKMEKLERALLSHSVTSGPHSEVDTPASGQTTAVDSPDDLNVRAALQERAFTAIERVVEIPGPHGTGRFLSSLSSSAVNDNRNGVTTSTDVELWPNIVSTSKATSGRTAKWERDLLSVFDALPKKDQLDYLIDFYFTQVQVLHSLFEALETALNCAQWLLRPQFRTLQAVVIVALVEVNCQGPYYSSVQYGPHTDWTRCMYFDVAVGLCKGLQLHKINSAYDVTRLQDPALPACRPIYSFQMASRTFHAVYFLDTLSICAGALASEDVYFVFPEHYVTTREPDNYTDEALLSETPVRPRDAWEKTPFVWEYHMNVCGRFMRITGRLLRHTEDLSYETLMEQSQALREPYQNFLSLGTAYDLNPIESDLFYLMNTSYLQRFLRLHRPFLLRSYRDPNYAQSQTIMLSAARQIVRSHRQQLNAGMSRSKLSRIIVRNASYPYIHHMSSLLALFLHALLDPDSRSEVREDLMTSKEVFGQVLQVGEKFHITLAAKGYCLAAEMIKVIDDPPLDVENIEDIVRDLQSKAVQSRMALLESIQTSKMAAEFRPVDASSPTGMDAASLGGMTWGDPLAMPLFPDMAPESWDIE